MKHTKTNGEEESADTIAPKREERICPVCGERVRVSEPRRGGTAWRDGKNYHLDCLLETVD